MPYRYGRVSGLKFDWHTHFLPSSMHHVNHKPNYFSYVLVDICKWFQVLYLYLTKGPTSLQSIKLRFQVDKPNMKWIQASFDIVESETNVNNLATNLLYYRRKKFNVVPIRRSMLLMSSPRAIFVPPSSFLVPHSLTMV